MSDIAEIHEDIFQFLISWSGKERRFNGINPYFYLRSSRDKRLRKGYWFPGNEEYLCVSFWKGGDSYNKTPNIYLDINLKHGIRLIAVSKDSDEKFEFMSKMFGELNSVYKTGYKKKSSKLWIKEFSKDSSDYIRVIENFVATDKKYIDEYLNSNLSDLAHEEFVQPLDFIQSVQFEEMHLRVHNMKQELYYERIKTLNISRVEGILPFALRGFEIEQYHGINKTKISDLPANAQWIVLTGENGYGKTSIMQAIALGLNSNSDMEKYVDEKTRINCDIVLSGNEDSVTRVKGSLAQISNTEYEDLLLGYGPSRLNVQAETSQNVESRSNNNIIGLFESTTLLKNLNYELFVSYKVDENIFKTLSAIIKEVTNGRINDVKVENREVLFQEVVNDEQEMVWNSIDNLAAGFRGLINLVGDIYIRLSEQHRGLKFKDFYGIVLIDELENHLHPVLQKELPGALSKIFPKLQFITTTHSPIPLMGTPEHTVILTVSRTISEGIVVKRLPKLETQIHKLLPDTLLTSAIFDFNYLDDLTEEDFNNLPLEDNYQDIEKNKEIEERLKNLNPDIFPDNLFDEY